MTDETGPQGTRDRILIAAATMLGEDPFARLSVRAVAARAGVSTGSLRHFFPTQQALLDTVMDGIYRLEILDEPIREVTGTPGQRLAACMRQVLALIGAGEQARAFWLQVAETHLAAARTDEGVATYLALEAAGVRRLEGWLDVLVEEGALAEGDNAKRARFLSTVLNGLSIERALPSAAAGPSIEEDTLEAAVHAVMNGFGASAPRPD